MRLKSLFIEEKDALTELHEALKSGTASPIVARHSDEALLQFLTRYHKKKQTNWFYITSLVILPLVGLGYLMGWWQMPFFILFMFLLTLMVVHGPRRFRDNELPRHAWTPILIRLESASLPILLDIDRLNIAPLRDAVRTGLTKRLAVVTTDELESLTPLQRDALLWFTLAQINPKTMPYYSLQQMSEERSRAATVGFLAMATLKLRGAEQITSRNAPESHVNLQRAIQEYKSALESS